MLYSPYVPRILYTAQSTAPLLRGKTLPASVLDMALNYHGEAQVLELFGVSNTPSLPLLPGLF